MGKNKQHENQNSQLSRREILRGAAGFAAMGIFSEARPALAGEEKTGGKTMKAQKGRINQSFAAWCYTGNNGNKWSLEELCRVANKLNVPALEVLEPEDFPLLKKYGLVCSLTNSHLFVRGMNNPKHWDECLSKMRRAIDATSEAGWPNVITFTGFADTTNEGGSKVSPEKGVKNCVEGYEKIVGYAEEKKVTLCLEMLNSRDPVEMKGHPGYQGDHTDYVMEIINKIGSPSLKILFDIYHVQIMDGDVIRRIGECGDKIGHVHMAGNPGRNEMDSSQEINYPPVLKALLETGYSGYCAHEWIPTRDAERGLAEAVALCDDV